MYRTVPLPKSGSWQIGGLALRESHFLSSGYLKISEILPLVEEICVTGYTL